MLFVLQSVVLCGIFTLAIVKGTKEPIKGILSYPPAIRRRVESLPAYRQTIQQEEKTHLLKKLFSIPILVVLLSIACWIGGARGFSAAFFYGFVLFLVVNLWDLVVLDWLWFCRSAKVRIPGTEDMDKEYRDPWFHLRGFGIGVGIGLFVSLLSAGLMAGLHAISG